MTDIDCINTATSCLAWHAHHQSDFPLELLASSFAARLDTINTLKRSQESSAKIALRKKLFKLVRPTPQWLLGASNCLLNEFELFKIADRKWQSCGWRGPDNPWRAAYAQYTTAVKAWEEEVHHHLHEVIAMHAEQCGCAWTPENNNIFSQL